VSTAPVDAWRADWERAQGNTWPFRQISAWLLRRRLRKQLALPVLPDPERDLPVLAELQSLEKRMAAATRDLPAGSPWNGLETDDAGIEPVIAAAKAVREATAQLATDLAELPELRTVVHRLFIDGRELLQDGLPGATAAERVRKAADRFETALADYLREAGGDAPGITDIADIAELRSQAQAILDLQPRINAWCRWQKARQEAEAAGLNVLVEGLEGGSLEATDAEDTFRTAYCDWLAPRLIDSREPLRTFAAVDHEEKIRLFREVDQNLAALSTGFIRARLSGDIPDPDAPHRDSGYGVLQRELNKKMRHLPVRQLIDKMGNALTALTPCLLMSPLSASQYLVAGNQLFDLVVFDEASQITVWDAIGAIARGRNVIVVGDPKQMPPTSFFDRSAANDDDEESLLTDDLESILDEALAASVKLHRLTGHYRSRHESLIAFSNHRYYGGDLVTYPAADTRETAVSFRRVAGLYQRGSGRTNPDEAKAIVAEIVQRLTDPERAKLSIGVVTMNADQQRLIDDLLDQERRANPELEKYFGDDALEPVFVKNLETVQGDQRDVILLSVGYGPDAPGARTMSMNFGPLNKKGGERRLNVAITRAASEVVLFASFDPSMIDLTRTSANAVRDLKHYMEFAQRGPAALGEAVLSVGGLDQYESEFEETVAEGLRRRGWNLHTQIGVSKFRVDLGVVHPDAPGRYLAGIECDGATYHRSPSARDRDRVRQAVLENLGWKLVRIWSTDFFIDPARTLDKVDTQLRGILAATTAEPEEGATQAKVPSPEPAARESRVAGLAVHEPETSWAKADFASAEDAEAPHPAAAGGMEEDLDPDMFYDDDYLPVIRGYACRLIDEAGPITFDDLSARIARAHRFQRTGRQIRARILEAVVGTRAQTGDSESSVYWPSGVEPQKVIPYRGRKVGGVDRGWADVPHAEKLGLAQEIEATRTGDDAITAMANRIGIGRLSRQLREELAELLREIS
jgi:very-short-patch-repair endonuclease